MAAISSASQPSDAPAAAPMPTRVVGARRDRGIDEGAVDPRASA
ncbi:hypothetical protein AB5I41_27695 [Sphingomonas sp. MMS24-JH45]